MTIPPGTRVDRYVIDGSIGAGSMGDVLLGIDVDLQRKVAIKILSERHRSNKELQGRFSREGRAVAAISHANVVQVFSTGTYEERPYIAMEFLAGIDLQSYVDRNGPMGAMQAVAVAIDAAKGLQAAAEAGLIHRDVKPSNLVLLDNGTLKVTDFGLAKPKDPKSEPALTALGVVVGTPDYIAPEQARGDTLDERVDIYALGGTIYFLVTGTPPFRKGNVNDDKYLKVVARHLRDPAPDPRARVPSLDGELAQLILRLMSKSASERPRYPELLTQLGSIANRLANAAAPAEFKPKHPSQPAPTPFLGGDHRYGRAGDSPAGGGPAARPGSAGHGVRGGTASGDSASRTLLHTPAAPIRAQSPIALDHGPSTPAPPRPQTSPGHGAHRPDTGPLVPSAAPMSPVPGEGPRSGMAPQGYARHGSAPPTPAPRPGSEPPVAFQPPRDDPRAPQRDILRTSQRFRADDVPTPSRSRWPLALLTIFAVAVLVVGIGFKLRSPEKEASAAAPAAPADAAPPIDAAPPRPDAAPQIPAGMVLVNGPAGSFLIGREPISRREYLAVFPNQDPGGSGPDAAVTRVSRTHAQAFARARQARLASAAELSAARGIAKIATTGLHEWTADSDGDQPIALSPQGEAVPRKDRGYSDQTFRIALDLPKK